jgi:hypothetical protein
VYTNYGSNASWYTFDLDAFQVLDEASICQAVVSKWTGAGYSTGESAVQNAAYNSKTGISNVYSNNDTSTDSFWNWATGNKGSSSSSTEDSTWLFPTRNNHSYVQRASTALSPMEIAWIVVLSVAVTAMFMHVTRKQVLKRKLKRQDKEIYIQTDDRGTPLIIS